jgi:lipase ATG15
MVAIRGTTNAWDALTDAQLWSAAGLFQVLRFMLPAGGVWTPILYRMVHVISWLESSSINRVAFYRETTAFVQYLLASNCSETFK